MKRSKKKQKLIAGEKVQIFSADGKVLRGEFTVKELTKNGVVFAEPLEKVLVGDFIWTFTR